MRSDPLVDFYRDAKRKPFPFLETESYSKTTQNNQNLRSNPEDPTRQATIGCHHPFLLAVELIAEIGHT